MRFLMVKADRITDDPRLQPSSDEARVRFANAMAEVTGGPSAETKELIAGYWMIQVRSKAEAIEWAHRAPFET